ncbi:MAG: hypothetical protein R6U38_05615 [Desulfatiglandaceae bacterium]
MEPEIDLELDGIPINSTSDGKVAVMDAIYAVTGLDCPQTVWGKLISDHPEILNYCEAYPFQEGKKRLVVDVEGWEKIFVLLPEYLAEGC